jgi:hypothetical protein
MPWGFYPVCTGLSAIAREAFSGFYKFSRGTLERNFVIFLKFLVDF